MYLFLLQDSYSRAIEILRTHQKEHKLLSEALVKHESLNEEEVKTVIEGKLLPDVPLMRKIKEGVSEKKK